MRKASDIATCMSYTGIDPLTREQGFVAKQPRDRKLQRVVLQCFKPENWFELRQALIEAGRQHLIGGCAGLIPVSPPPAALTAARAGWIGGVRRVRLYGESPSPKTKGYRPHRRTAKRRGQRG